MSLKPKSLQPKCLKQSYLLTLALTLTAGLAQAQNTAADGTLSGTIIENTATASYADPEGSGTTNLTSNRVTTEVLPKPAFDIVYFGGYDGLGSATQVGNTPATASTVPADSAVGTVAAGSTFRTPYILVNNGNTAQTIALGSTSAGGNTPVSVLYYADTNGDGILQDSERQAGAVTSLSLAYDNPATTADEGVTYFIQEMTLPTGAAPNSTYTASPVGTGQLFDEATLTSSAVAESATVLGLQYATVTVANQPPVPADVTNAALVNTVGATPISPLVATDDGTVSSYIIQTLPDPASGVLYYNGAPVTAGQVITDPTKLSFDPADGFIGNVTFDYTATDNLNLGSSTNKNADGTVTSGPATYTIPVQASPQADLKVEKTNTNPSTSPTGWVDQADDIVKVNVISYYYVKVTNNGPAPVSGAVLTDTVETPGISIGTSIGCTATGTTSGTNMCTSTNKPTNTQLAAGYVLPTIAPGDYFEIYVGIPTPTSPTSSTLSNLVTVTAPNTVVDSNPDNNSARDVDRFGFPPIPNDTINPTLRSDDGPIALDPNLSATDDKNNVVSFTISTLPRAETGVLYFNGVPVTVNQVIPAEQIGLLTFDPKLGFEGTASFTYQATDGDKLTSSDHRQLNGTIAGSPATYYIPVTVPRTAQQPLSCQSTMYGLFAADSNTTGMITANTIRSVTASGTVGDVVAYIPFAYRTVAALAVSPDGTKLYISAKLSDNTFGLQQYDMLTSTWKEIGKLDLSTTDSSISPTSGSRPVRMAIDQNGNGYISTSNYIWSFDANAGTLNPTPKVLNFDGSTTGLSPVPTLVDVPGTSFLSGDFISDADGNIYLIANPEAKAYIDVYRVSNLGASAPVVSYISRIPHNGTGTFAGMAALSDSIYGSADTGAIEKIDLGVLSVAQTGQAPYAMTDLTSCYYPTLRANVGSTKVVTDLTTGSSTTAAAGDTLEYTITIRNTGNITADGVTFQDTLPAGTTYVPGSTTTNGVSTPDINGAFPYSAAQAVKSPGTDVANGTTNAAISVSTDRDVVIKFRVTVNAGTTTVSNQGNVTYNNTTTGTSVQTTVKTDDPTPPGTQDPTVIGAGLPALSVTKDVSSKVVRITAGTTDDTQLTLAPQQLTYTITVTNTGNAPANNVAVTDTLPAGLTYVSATGTPALSTEPTVSGQQLSFTIGSLAVGATQTISVVTTVAPTPNTNQTALTNVAGATADTVAAVTSSPVVTEILYPKLRKTVTNITRGTAAGTTADGVPGDELEYCLAFSNYGSVALPNFTITDDVPSNTTANLSGYGAGLGVQLTRAGAVSTATSAADTDAGSLTSTGGQFSSGIMSISLGSLTAGEQGQACFRVRIK